VIVPPPLNPCIHLLGSRKTPLRCPTTSLAAAETRGSTTTENDLDAFNSDPTIRTDVIDGLSAVRSADRLAVRLTDLGEWIARRLSRRAS